MKTASLIILLFTLVAAPAPVSAQTTMPPTEYLETLKEGCWICVSPEAYDQAVERERNLHGQDLDALKKQLLEQKLCMYADAELVGRMMVPYATVVERNGTKVKVQFTLEYRKRLEFLHRMISRAVMAGWTASTNLVKKPIL